MAYYGKLYNSYGLNDPIQIGDRVDAIEHYQNETTVLWVGVVVKFDNTKASEGYTVLVQTDDDKVWPTTVWTRPDELRHHVA